MMDKRESSESSESPESLKELQRQAKRYREFVEGSDDLMTQVGPGAELLFLNRTAQRVFGLEPEACVGRSAFEFIHPEDRARTVAEFERWVRERLPSATHENRQVSADGSVRHMLWTINLHYDDDGNFTFANSIAREITEQREAERRVVESERKYRELVETSQDLIWECDEKGCFTYLNPTWEETHGYRVEEMLGRPFSDFQTPEVFARDVEEFGRHLAGGAVRGYRTTHIHKDGSVIDLLFNGIPLLDTNGNIIGTRGTAQDISDRKRAEMKERELLVSLADAKRVEALGVLAGGVAHDLNNVLGPLVALPEILLEDLRAAGCQDRSLEEDIAEGLEILDLASRRAKATIRDLIALGRRGLIQKQALDLSALVADLVRSAEIRELVRDRPEVSLQYNVTEGFDALVGSQEHLERVLSNLVRNALEAVPAAGGRVEVSTTGVTLENQHVGREIIEPGAYIRLSVTDNGTGIDPKDLPRIFEPFYSRKRRTARSGSGLGLAVVHGIVKDHDGFLDVIDVPEGGTSFHVYLPVEAEAAKRGTPLETARLVAVGGDERVLVVDDEPSQRYLAARVLSRMGYTVAQAENGRAALQLFDAAHRERGDSPFDLVVIDMIMESELDGLQTLREIRKLFPNQKAVISSGHAAQGSDNAARALGAPWLCKPYQADDLAKIVRGMLDQT